MDHLNENGMSVEDEILRDADEAETEDMMEKTDEEKAEEKEKVLEKAEAAEEKTEEKGLTRQEKEAEEALKKSAEKMMKEADRKKSFSEIASEGHGKKPEPAQSGREKREERKEDHREDRRPLKKDPKDQKIEELEDRLKRNLAEFDNYRKRTEKEKAAMFDMGAKDILEKFLPVIDNFERSLAAAPDTEECKAYTDGMNMIYRQLLKNLEDAGVKPIDCKGKPFDPTYHNAVMHVDDESLGENEVAEELQKGYLYKDSVLRHSMVKVAN